MTSKTATMPSDFIYRSRIAYMILLLIGNLALLFATFDVARTFMLTVATAGIAIDLGIVAVNAYDWYSHKWRLRP